MWKFSAVLLLLALPPIVNSKEIPTPRTQHTSSTTPATASLGMCAVCPEPRCATVSGIWLKGNDESILWKKQDEEIPQCFNDNLKSDKPCQVPNGNLVLRTVDELEFEWKNLTSRDAGLISSENKPCADLNLPPSSTPSPVTKAPIHNTSTPAAPNISVADNKGRVIGSVIGGVIGGISISIGIGIGIGGVIGGVIGGISIGIGIGSVIGIIISIAIGVLIWKRNSRGQGQDGDHRHGNNGVPPHDAEDRDENTIQMQPLNAEVPNGNVTGVH